MSHDEKLHNSAVSAARLYENLKEQESLRTNLRRQWLALVAENPELKRLDSEIAAAERATKSLKESMKDAIKEWQSAAADAYVDGWSKSKTFQDGMVTAVTRQNVIVDSDSSAMLQFGIKVVKEFPEYIGVLFRPDPNGFKKLATDNPDAIQRIGFLSIPPEVMRVESVVSGRINKGWEQKAVELLPLRAISPELPANVLTGEAYPSEFNQIRPLILERDHWSCMSGDCFEYGDGLHIHHINQNKSDNVPTNLVALCRVCHGKFGNDDEANRQFALGAKRRTWEAPIEWRDQVFHILGSKMDWRSWNAENA